MGERRAGRQPIGRVHAIEIPVAGPGTDLISTTAPRGVPHVVTYAEAAAGGALADDRSQGVCEFFRSLRFGNRLQKQ
jgi:hypothetical protein